MAINPDEKKAAMFTGIIEEVGAIAAKRGAELVIMAETVLEDARLGDSIAVNGVCLTVNRLFSDRFTAQVSPETFTRSTLGKLSAGAAVNLERAMKADGRFGGHFVLGHVDGVGRIVSIQDQGDFALWTFQAPPEVACYLVPKGSVAIDGISLTLVAPEKDRFSVALIPSTIAHTTLSKKRSGDWVNLEADTLGKHIFHYLQEGRASTGVSRDFLAQHGFL